MDVISSIRGNPTSFLVSTGTEQTPTESLRNEDAAILEFHSGKSNVEPQQLETVASEIDVSGLTGNTKELHDKITDAFSALSPAIGKQYKALLASTIHHRERLSHFIAAVSKVVSHLKPLPPNPEGNSPPLSIGKSLSFNLPGQIDAAHSASVNGDVSVKKFALDVGEDVATDLEVENDFDVEQESHVQVPVAVAAYEKAQSGPNNSSHDLLA